MVDEYEPWVGIDLGTTYSCVGIYLPNKEVEIVKCGNNNTVPSYVQFLSEHEIVVGQQAREASFTDQQNVVYDAKRVVGRTAEDPKIQHLKQKWPYDLMDDNEGRPQI